MIDRKQRHESAPKREAGEKSRGDYNSRLLGSSCLGRDPRPRRACTSLGPGSLAWLAKTYRPGALGLGLGGILKGSRYVFIAQGVVESIGLFI